MDYESETEFGYDGGYDEVSGGSGGVGFMGIVIIIVVTMIIMYFVGVGVMAMGWEGVYTWGRDMGESDAVKKLRADADEAIKAKKAEEEAAAAPAGLSAVWKNNERLSSNSGYHNKSQYAGLERTCGARNNA